MTSTRVERYCKSSNGFNSGFCFLNDCWRHYVRSITLKCAFTSEKQHRFGEARFWKLLKIWKTSLLRLPMKMTLQVAVTSSFIYNISRSFNNFIRPPTSNDIRLNLFSRPPNELSGNTCAPKTLARVTCVSLCKYCEVIYRKFFIFSKAPRHVAVLWSYQPMPYFFSHELPP